MKRSLLWWRMSGLVLALALTLTPLLALANGPTLPMHSHTQSQDSTSNAVSDAAGGAGGSIDYFNGGSRSYALFSATAAPLPSTTCPKGDSSYVQVFWGLLTVASSTTRTEMECLDKVLTVMRASPAPQIPKLPSTGQIHPPLADPSSALTQPAAQIAQQSEKSGSVAPTPPTAPKIASDSKRKGANSSNSTSNGANVKPAKAKTKKGECEIKRTGLTMNLCT